jgi:hypothetical protein
MVSASGQDTAVPVVVTAAPTLPAWNWDDPKGEKYSWVPAVATVAGIAVVVVAADLILATGWTNSLISTVSGAGGKGAAKGAAAAAAY